MNNGKVGLVAAGLLVGGWVGCGLVAVGE